MPIYEYQCRKCGKTSEFLTGLGVDEGISCKICGSHDLEKVMSTTSFLSKIGGRPSGRTCCGKEERCDTPPCSNGGICRKD